MKKMFYKISKILFVLGIVGLIGLLVLVCSGLEELTGGFAMAAFLCVLLIFVMVINTVLAFAVMLIEGLKKDKKAVLIKILTEFGVLVLVFSLVKWIDRTAAFDFGKIVLQCAVMTVAILGGEAILAKHEEE